MCQVIMGVLITYGYPTVGTSFLSNYVVGQKYFLLDVFGSINPAS